MKISLGRLFLVLMAAGIGLAAISYWNATRDPVVRTADVVVADWPKGAPPMRVLLISDIHVSEPDMPPARLSRLVTLFNGLKPDMVAIAGDLATDERTFTRGYTPEEAVAPLAALRSRFGTLVVLGNNDHWKGAVQFRNALIKSGATVLQNQAVKRGPLVVGGIDDAFTNHADLAATYHAMDRLSGVRILITHSPDVMAKLPGSVTAVFAGHTHCGQVNKPWSGEPIQNVSRFGMRFQCGDINDRGQRLFVTAGLGTSVAPFRFGAPPDAWLVTFGPSLASAPAPAPARPAPRQ